MAGEGGGRGRKLMLHINSGLSFVAHLNTKKGGGGYVLGRHLAWVSRGLLLLLVVWLVITLQLGNVLAEQQQKVGHLLEVLVLSLDASLEHLNFCVLTAHFVLVKLR